MKKTAIIFLLIFIGWSLFAQETENLENKFLHNTRQLIYEGNRSGEGYFSEDGRYLIFQSEREEGNPFYQIYILDFETGDIHRVSPGYGKTTCSYFQWNGDRVEFASTHLDPDSKKLQQKELDFRASGKKRRYSWDYDTHMDIFSANRDGSDIKRLTEAKGYDAEGSYSPDGNYIVFSSNRHAYDHKLSEEDQKHLDLDPSYFCDLYIMKADGSDKKQLTDVPGYDGGPFFSPDGKRIIWRRFTVEGDKADVYTMNTDGTDVKRLTDFGCLSWAPFYHPSGDYIVWAANKLGFSNFEIYMTDAQGLKEPIRVTFTDGFDGLPVFSPDGKKLVWTSQRTSNGQAQLFIADWDDAFAREQLAEAPYRQTDTGSLDYDFTPAITVQELNEKLSYIASDEMEGRMTGSKGIHNAADYITHIFKNQGLKPLAGHDNYLWPFDFVSKVKVNESENSMSLNGEALELNKDFRPMASTENGDVNGPVVFAGYGLKIHDGSGFEYDSYSSLDVKGKMIMVLDGIPTDLDEEKEKLFDRSIASGYKQMIARQNGAKAILVVENKISEESGHEIVGTSGIVSVNISHDVADKILKGNEETVENLTGILKNGDPKDNDHLFETKSNVELKTHVERVVSKDNNIVGMIPSYNPNAGYIFIGAHYDHLGYGEVNSNSPPEHKHDIHNGADDDGSGTVAVIELSEYFSGMKKENPEKIKDNLVFCLWSGEELGLIGSNAFTKDLPIPANKIKAYLNFDMVGRMKNNKLDIQGIGSADEWKGIFEKKNVVSGFNLNFSDDPYLPTDATSFYLKKIPVVNFFTGVHLDYHTYRDDVEFINFDDLQRITKFASLVVSELMKPDVTLGYKEVQVKARKTSKGPITVSLGTIPAYGGSDQPGVQIQGVRPGGPADKAGLQADDVIVGLNGKEINNIYDFMNILNELKADVATDIVVMRSGEKKDIKIVPEAKQ